MFRRAAFEAALRAPVRAFPSVVPYAGVVIPGPVIALRVLTPISGATDEGDHGGYPVVLEVTRGLPHNVTTEMDLALWATARHIQADPAALADFRERSRRRPAPAAYHA